jgi:mRNA interferase RelE/StbE
MFEVVLAPDVTEFYAAADRPLPVMQARCFQRLEANPRQGNNIKRLTGEWAG